MKEAGYQRAGNQEKPYGLRGSNCEQVGVMVCIISYLESGNCKHDSECGAWEFCLIVAMTVGPSVFWELMRESGTDVRVI